MRLKPTRILSGALVASGFLLGLLVEAPRGPRFDHEAPRQVAAVILGTFFIVFFSLLRFGPAPFNSPKPEVHLRHNRTWAFRNVRGYFMPWVIFGFATLAAGMGQVVRSATERDGVNGSALFGVGVGTLLAVVAYWGRLTLATRASNNSLERSRDR